jgi:hypothetical protein
MSAAVPKKAPQKPAASGFMSGNDSANATFPAERSLTLSR